MTDKTNDLNGVPPRGELFASPSAKAVWAAVVTLEPASQWDVLRALQERLGAAELSGENVRVQRAIAALREAADLLGASPGKNEFEALRLEQRDRKWPSASTIRTWLGGSWNHCLGRAHLDAVPDGDALVMELGLQFTAQEVVDAMRQCADELGHVPSLSQFIGWAKRPDVRRRPERRPMSVGPFERLFGGYAAALAASGLYDVETGAFQVPMSTRVRSGVYAHTDEQLLDALREIAALLGRSPMWDEYVRERERILRETTQAGRPRPLPAMATIQRRFGSIDAALEKAGLEPHRHRERVPEGQPVCGAPRTPEPRVIAALRRAYAEVGDPFTSNAYQAWRLGQIRRDPIGASQGLYPTYQTVQRRYGGWRAAVLRMEELADEGESGTEAAA